MVIFDDGVSIKRFLFPVFHNNNLVMRIYEWWWHVGIYRRNLTLRDAPVIIIIMIRILMMISVFLMIIVLRIIIMVTMINNVDNDWWHCWCLKEAFFMLIYQWKFWICFFLLPPDAISQSRTPSCLVCLWRFWLRGIGEVLFIRNIFAYRNICIYECILSYSFFLSSLSNHSETRKVCSTTAAVLSVA